jgi:hypothetical protein
MTLLYHEDMLQQLAKRNELDQSKKRQQLSDLLEGNRKGSNANYQAVVHGHRPSKASAKDQRVASQLSRANLKEYWMQRMEGDL